MAVICNHVPLRAGDSGLKTKVKYRDFTFEVSRLGRGYAGIWSIVRCETSIWRKDNKLRVSWRSVLFWLLMWFRMTNIRFLLRIMNVHLEYIAVISSHASDGKISRWTEECHQIPWPFFILSVRLCSRFTAGVHDIIRIWGFLNAH